MAAIRWWYPRNGAAVRMVENGRWQWWWRWRGGAVDEGALAGARKKLNGRRAAVQA